MITRREVQVMGYAAWKDGTKLGCPHLRYWPTHEGIDPRASGWNERDINTWVAESRDPCPRCERGELFGGCHNKGRSFEPGHKLVLVEPPFEMQGE